MNDLQPLLLLFQLLALGILSIAGVMVILSLAMHWKDEYHKKGKSNSKE